MNIYELQNKVTELIKKIDNKDLRYVELREILKDAAKRKYIILKVKDFNLTKTSDRQQLYRVAQDFIKKPAITKSTLKQRGWNDGTIAKYLGASDVTLKNPVFKNAAPMQLYLLGRVEIIEQEPQVKAELAKIAVARSNRQQAARKAVETKAEKLINWVDSLEIEIPIIDLEDLIRQSISHYNWFWQSRSDRPSEKYADFKDSSEFLRRITVNYLRHECTNYEEQLEEIGGKVGIETAYEMLKSKVNNAIYSQYPNLEKSIVNLQIQRHSKQNAEKSKLCQNLEPV